MIHSDGGAAVSCCRIVEGPVQIGVWRKRKRMVEAAKQRKKTVDMRAGTLQQTKWGQTMQGAALSGDERLRQH